MLHLRAARAVLAEGLVEGASLLVERGTITWAGATASCTPPPDAREEPVRGTLVPGFVDVQINGFGGKDFMAAGEEAWRAAGDLLLASGTTSFLPTLISARPRRMREAVRTAVRGVRSLDRPRPLGLHLEGPLLSPRYPGAHDPEAIDEARPEHLLDYLEEGDGAVRVVTLAPERPGALEVVRELTGAGVFVSVGHTDATYDGVRAAVEAGARGVTHLFNAQRPLHHREPGVPGAALDLPDLACGFILDLHHLHPAVSRAFLRWLAGRAYLVTDAVAPAGLPPGTFDVMGREVSTRSGAPRLPDGTLFGSVLTMAQAFANAVRLGFSLEEAARWTATAPATLAGRSDLGRLAAGTRADLVALDDDLRVRRVWVDGVEVTLDAEAAPRPTRGEHRVGQPEG